MITFLLATSLSLAPLSDPDLAEEGARSATYDLSSVSGVSRPDESVTTALLPVFVPRELDLEGEEAGEQDLARLEEELFDLLIQLYPDEFEFEGRSSDLLPDGRMLLRGPDSLHQRVARVLQFLDGVVNAEVELGIDLVRLPGRTGLPDRTVVTIEDADAWLAAVPATNRRRLALRLRADRDAELDLTTERTVIMSQLSEIAEGSFTHDPLVVGASFGDRIAASASPRIGGLDLALTLSRGELSDGLVQRDIGLYGTVLTDAGTQRGAAPSLVQTFDLLNRSLSLSTFVPDGHAVLLSTLADGGATDLREVVVVRRIGGELPLTAELELDANGSRLSVVNTSFLAPARTMASGPVLHGRTANGLLLTWHPSKPWNTPPLLATTFQRSHPGELFEETLHGTDDLDGLSIASHGPWMFLSPEDQDGRERRSQELALGLVSELAGAPEGVEVTLSLERASGAVVAQARLPLTTGRSTSLALGVERLDLVDYFVEVAQKAASPTLLLATSFDGLVLWLQPRITPSGNLVLSVRGGAHDLRSHDQLDLDSPLLDFIDQSEFEQLLVSERLTFERGAGARRVVLGSAQGGREGMSLVIEASF